MIKLTCNDANVNNQRYILVLVSRTGRWPRPLRHLSRAFLIESQQANQMSPPIHWSGEGGDVGRGIAESESFEESKLQEWWDQSLIYSLGYRDHKPLSAAFRCVMYTLCTTTL